MLWELRGLVWLQELVKLKMLPAQKKTELVEELGKLQKENKKVAKVA